MVSGGGPVSTTGGIDAALLVSALRPAHTLALFADQSDCLSIANYLWPRRAVYLSVENRSRAQNRALVQSQKPYPALARGVALQQHHYQPNTTNQTPDVAPTTPQTLNFMAHHHMWPTVPTLPLSLPPFTGEEGSGDGCVLQQHLKGGGARARC